MKQYLVIDVGGTNLKYALMTEETILEKGEIPTPLTNLDDFIETIGKLYDRYQTQISGIALSAPGRIDANTGFMYTAGALEYIHRVPMAELLKKRCPTPISIENDGKCAALAELWKGSLKDVQNGLVLTIGTGIGGGIIINGKLYRGTNFAAGELSTLPTSIEAFNPDHGYWAVINNAHTLIERYRAKSYTASSPADGRAFFKKVDESDEIALAVLDEFCNHFAIGLFAVQSILDIQRVAIGGGISAQDSLIRKINEKFTAMISSFPSYFPVQPMDIVRCAFSNDSNLYGALYHHLYE